MESYRQCFATLQQIDLIKYNQSKSHSDNYYYSQIQQIFQMVSIYKQNYMEYDVQFKYILLKQILSIEPLTLYIFMIRDEIFEDNNRQVLDDIQQTIEGIDIQKQLQQYNNNKTDGIYLYMDSLLDYPNYQKNSSQNRIQIYDMILNISFYQKLKLFEYCNYCNNKKLCPYQFLVDIKQQIDKQFISLQKYYKYNNHSQLYYMQCDYLNKMLNDILNYNSKNKIIKQIQELILITNIQSYNLQGLQFNSYGYEYDIYINQQQYEKIKSRQESYHFVTKDYTIYKFIKESNLDYKRIFKQNNNTITNLLDDDNKQQQIQDKSKDDIIKELKEENENLKKQIQDIKKLFNNL